MRTLNAYAAPSATATTLSTVRGSFSADASGAGGDGMTIAIVSRRRSEVMPVSHYGVTGVTPPRRSVT